MEVQYSWKRDISLAIFSLFFGYKAQRSWSTFPSLLEAISSCSKTSLDRHQIVQKHVSQSLAPNKHDNKQINELSFDFLVKQRTWSWCKYPVFLYEKSQTTEKLISVKQICMKKNKGTMYTNENFYSNFKFPAFLMSSK